MAYTVRGATKEDLPKIITLGFREYVEEMAYLIGLNFSFLHLKFAYDGLIDDPRTGCVLAAEEEGEIVGFYSCRYLPSPLDHRQLICTESGWYVHPEHRGKGIGRALLVESNRRAFELGIRMKKVAHAVTTEAGRSLMAWYERMGYVPFETVAFKLLTEEDLK